MPRSSQVRFAFNMYNFTRRRVSVVIVGGVDDADVEEEDCCCCCCCDSVVVEPVVVLPLLDDVVDVPAPVLELLLATTDDVDSLLFELSS